jgi:hypothetical protein
MKNKFLFFISLFVLCGAAMSGQTVPTAGKYYTIKNVSASLNLTNDGTGGAKIVTLSLAQQLFYLESVNSGTQFAVKHYQSGKYLKSGGSNSWDISFADNNSANSTWFTITLDGTNYRIQGSNGHLAPDNTSSGSAVYCNKAANNTNGVWTFDEVSETEIKNALQADIDKAQTIYNEEFARNGTEAALATAFSDFNTIITNANTTLTAGTFNLLDGLDASVALLSGIETLFSVLAPYYNPEQGKFYLIRHIHASIAGNNKLYLSSDGATNPLIATYTGIEQVFYLSPHVADGSKYTIEQVSAALYLADRGDNNWNTTFTSDYASSNAMFSLPFNHNFYRIQGSRGYYATDDAGVNGWIFCNKGADHANGKWFFEEATDANVLAALQQGLPEYISIAQTLYDSETPEAGTPLEVLHTALQTTITAASGTISDLTTAVSVFENLKNATIAFKTGVTEKNTPQAGRCYTVRQVSGDLFLVKKENGEAGITAAGEIFYITQAAGNKFYIDHLFSGKSLTDGGSNSWSTSFIDYCSANVTSFNFVKEGGSESYRIQGNAGYYASDNTTDGSAVYCDKVSNHANGVWLFEEVSVNDALIAGKSGLPAYIQFATGFYGEITPPATGSHLYDLYQQINVAITTANPVITNSNPTSDDVFNAINGLKDAVFAYKNTLDAYEPLKQAIERFETLMNNSAFVNDPGCLAALNAAKGVYSDPTDQTANIQTTIDALNQSLEPMWASRALKTTITNANRMKEEALYGDATAQNTFANAITDAQNVLDASTDETELRTAIQTLKGAVDAYLSHRNPNDWWITIKNGALWKDDRGQTVQAHGAGFLQVGDTWYMIGEDRETAKWNPDINMYSSKDFVNWKFESKIVANGEHSFTYADGTTGTLGGNRMIERPKLLYCKRTGQYVIWCHWEAGNYGASEAAVFYSDDVTGPYKMHYAGRPMGIKSRDCNVFQDHDGNAYFVSTTSENTNLGVFKLSDDYLDAVSHDVILAGQRREAPAIVRIGNTYHMLSSACSGWAPNQCQYHHSTSLIAGWSGATNLNHKLSYDTQAASVLTIAGTTNTSYLYVGDRWQDPDLAESKTIIFPISFNGTNCTFDYSQQFDVNLVTGETRATTSTNRIDRSGWTVIDVSSEQPGHEGSKAIDGISGSFWHTNWNTSSPAPHHITVDMGTINEVSGFLSMPRLDNDYNGIIREYVLYVSTDNITWEVASAGYWMPYGGEIYFPKVNARYFKLVALPPTFSRGSNEASTPYASASASEIYLLKDVDSAPAIIEPRYKAGDHAWTVSGQINVIPGTNVILGPNASPGQGTWTTIAPDGTIYSQREITLNTVTVADAGTYTTYFLDAYNQVATFEYTLTVSSNLAFDLNTTTFTLCSDDAAGLSLYEEINTPVNGVTYWYSEKNDGNDLTELENGQLIAVNTLRAGSYWVYSKENNTLISTPKEINLTIEKATKILTQPVDCSVLTQGVIELAVNAEGEGTLSYQWQKKEDNNFVDINGVVNPTASTKILRITSANHADAGTYRLIVTGNGTACTSAVVSNEAQVTVSDPIPPAVYQITVTVASGISMSGASDGQHNVTEGDNFGLHF